AVNSRHQSCLELSRKGLIGAKEGLINGLEPEYVALDVRSALNSIGEIVGQVDVEDLLGEIFGSFCIGK
ncbi:MAG: tRNA uridine-5-carboxymethylaminomethyl(34) synthesis GTPase MnmE, partial [Verrucomicrobiota bacterium]|nr:tRNA uridine-5-carboxymethylaminomethyl(34) synthesis GTPase MnmE [Verrucomicrobiota bacterium]